MGFKDKLGDVRRAVNELAAAADGLENKHLRDLIHDAAGRLHDAAGHPQVDEVEKPEPAQTGEPNHMDPGPQSYSRAEPFPGAQTGEPNPMDPGPQPTPPNPFDNKPAPAQTGEPNHMDPG